MAQRTLTAVVLGIVLVASRAGLAGGPRPQAQPKTHLGGKPGAMLTLVLDCRAAQVVCASRRCRGCIASDCTPATTGYPLCCLLCGGNQFGPSCTRDADCTPQNAGCGDTAACVGQCTGGDRAGAACVADADCPHTLVSEGDTCLAAPAGQVGGPVYVVPAGNALVVTDVLSHGTIELASDDRTAVALLDGAQHLTGGLVFPAGSHVNVRGVSGTELTVHLLAYLVKAR